MDLLLYVFSVYITPTQMSSCLLNLSTIKLYHLPLTPFLLLSLLAHSYYLIYTNALQCSCSDVRCLAYKEVDILAADGSICHMPYVRREESSERQKSLWNLLAGVKKLFLHNPGSSSEHELYEAINNHKISLKHFHCDLYSHCLVVIDYRALEQLVITSIWNLEC